MPQPAACLASCSLASGSFDLALKRSSFILNRSGDFRVKSDSVLQINESFNMLSRTISLLLGVSLVIVIGEGVTSAQSISIFGNAVPNNPINDSYAADTLGVKFWSSESGMISGSRFYRAVECPQDYVADLYPEDGTLTNI
jgi:Domain of unknown function (DUF4082)